MAIDYVRNIISSGYNLSKINDNFVKIEKALQDGLSRSGNGPNQLEADLDMNSNDILNVATISATDFTVTVIVSLGKNLELTFTLPAEIKTLG